MARSSPLPIMISPCSSPPGSAVLAWFVAAEWLDEAAAAGMLAWPDSGFGVHIGPAIAGEDRNALLRVARYSARAPVTESLLRYDADRAEVELVSDRSDGPFAGIHRFSALEFIAPLGGPCARPLRGPRALLRRLRHPTPRVVAAARDPAREPARGEGRAVGAGGGLARAARPQAALGRVAASRVQGRDRGVPDPPFGGCPAGAR